MGTSLDLQIAALLGRVELARHRALNFAQGCVVALDQVGLIAVHHAHGVGQRGSGARMQPCSHPAAGGRQGCHEIYDCGVVSSSRQDSIRLGVSITMGMPIL